MQALLVEMPSVRQAIESRLIIRKYVQEPIDRGDLAEILRQANRHPSERIVTYHWP